MTPTTIKFTKMHGLGNDFMVIDAITETIEIDKLPIVQLSNRHLGVGFDQLLLINKGKTHDFSCRFFNSDGSEAEQCGNGVRCVARFLHENNLLKGNSLSLETKAGTVEITIHDYDNIEVNMGKPGFSNSVRYQEYSFHCLAMGNPHAILQVNRIDDFPVAELGNSMQSLKDFPTGVNVGFIEIKNPDRIRLRTFERGVGETFACGSNACAAVVTGIKHHHLKNKVTVELPLGHLTIEWHGENHDVLMTGPASRVYRGQISGRVGSSLCNR